VLRCCVGRTAGTTAAAVPQFFVIRRLLLTTIRRFSIIISLYFRVFLAQFIVFLFLSSLSAYRRDAVLRPASASHTFRAASVRCTQYGCRRTRNLPLKSLVPIDRATVTKHSPFQIHQLETAKEHLPFAC